MKTELLVGGETIAVALTRTGAVIDARVGDAAVRGTVRRRGDVWELALGDRDVTATVVRERNDVWVAIDGEVYRCAAVPEERRAGGAGGTQAPRVTAPMPGKVLDVLVREGQTVAAGDALVVLEAMKMETVATAEAAGTVVRVHVAAGAMVEPGQTLVELAFG
jgi:acetyl-CoA/propionyl-CoA carboxylase biotin carboxyl carrier protein